MRTLLVTLALVGCSSERNIDDTHIFGSIVVPPTILEEGPDYENEFWTEAEELGDVTQTIRVEGVTGLWGRNRGEVSNAPDELPGKADEDWLSITPSEARELTVVLAYEEIPEGTFVRMAFYDITGPTPQKLGGEDVLRSGDDGPASWTGTFDLAPDRTYAIQLGGIAGSGNWEWTATLFGAPPDNVIVGAYVTEDGAAPDPLAKGNPVGGGGVHTWTQAEDGSWIGEYEIHVLQTVGPIRDSEDPNTLLDLEVDAELEEVWLIGMDNDNLNKPFTGGTRYTSEAARVDLTADTEQGAYDDAPWAPTFRTLTAPDLVLDAMVDRTIGWTFDEQEPNDAEVFEGNPNWTDPASWPSCNELGMLSAPGLTDTIRGVLVQGDANGFTNHENDCFHFQVEQESILYYSLSWGAGAENLDAVLWNAAGTYIDWTPGGPGVNPDSNAQPQILAPGSDWYMIVFGARGTAGAEPEYTLQMETTAR